MNTTAASPAPVATKGRHALVLGGGIAGLSAAAVLSRHFDEVTVVERDRYPSDPSEVRPHTAHGAHAHLLLAGGLVTLFRLVPELQGWMDEQGFPAGDLTHHTRVAFEGKWLPRARSGIPIRTCTRTDVERLLHRAATSKKNVRVLEEHTVQALLGKDRVTGARLAHAGVEQDVTADLVVDATGRASTSTRWLEEAGVPKVDEEIVDAGIVYTSAWFEANNDIDDDWTTLATLPSIPHDATMSVIIRFGARRMLASIIDYGAPKAPATHDELVARFAKMKAPQLHRLLLASKPTSGLASYGNTKNRWRRYGRLPRFPDGIVVVGDAVCSLNPRYGQGMTVASLSVDRLERELEGQFASGGNLDGFSHRFQKGLERVLMVPWQIALMEDRAWVSSLAGTAPSLPQRIALAGSQRVLKTAFSDITTYISFMRVAQLLDAPTKMLAPRTLGKIAMGPSGAVVDDAPGIGAA